MSTPRRKKVSPYNLMHMLEFTFNVDEKLTIQIPKRSMPTVDDKEDSGDEDVIKETTQ